MNIYSKTGPLRFYVYAYLREDGTPYYIGKGSGKRSHKHMSSERFKTPKDTRRIVILESSLTELGAFALERRMIRWYGRKDMISLDGEVGILRNLSDGGEGSSGYIMSDEQRELIRNTHLGKIVSAETRGKLAAAAKHPQCKSQIDKRVAKNTGKTRTDQTKQKMSKSWSTERRTAHSKLISSIQLGKRRGPYKTLS